MNDVLRDALDELIPPVPEPREWEHVVRRASAQTRRRRPLVLAAAAVVAVALSAPALGLHHDVVDFFSADPAPGPVLFDFASLRRHGPPGGRDWPFRDVVASEAREVTAVVVRGERRPLYVAPTETGGYCFHWYTMFGCRRDGDERPGPIGVMRLGGDDQPWMVNLTTQNGAIAELELLYEDGERVTVPFVWVSEPIDAGFAIFELPAEKTAPGHWPDVLVALSGEGDEVSRFDVLHP
jgi:hypothetical protein